MATTKQTLNHEYRPQVSIEPINPKYEDRMYVSGWLFSISTEYRKEMVSCDGYKQNWSCAVCGRDVNDELHKDEIVRVDRIN